MDLEQDSGAEDTIHLSEGTLGTSLFGKSALTVKGSLGETAVGFDFTPAQTSTSAWNDGDGLQASSSNLNSWPIVILWGDGRVFFVVTHLPPGTPAGQNSQPAARPRVMGPLPMLPESEDNYGSDACGILCLHPMISSPPILVCC